MPTSRGLINVVLFCRIKGENIIFNFLCLYSERIYLKYIRTRENVEIIRVVKYCETIGFDKDRRLMVIR